VPVWVFVLFVKVSAEISFVEVEVVVPGDDELQFSIDVAQHSEETLVCRDSSGRGQVATVEEDICFGRGCRRGPLTFSASPKAKLWVSERIRNFVGIVDAML
jgi:hypothetical protein